MHLTNKVIGKLGRVTKIIILILKIILFPFVNILRSIKFNLFSKNIYRGIYLFFYDMYAYIKLNDSQKFEIKFDSLYPVLMDRFSSAGSYDPHYFHQDIWAAKKVFLSKTEKHFDIGSKLDGFISHCLVFTKVTMIDIRALKKRIENLDFLQSDATLLNEIEDNSIESISSLHAIEHFGLGRYGDPVDPYGYIKVIKSIQRVSKKGADIYISVPIGIEKVAFHAHRVFNPETIVEYFNLCELAEFSVIDDHGNFYSNVDMLDYTEANYACGCFHFKKK